ncbi:unnamed protein product, partial [Amoebophrya sp. A120]
IPRAPNADAGSGERFPGTARGRAKARHQSTSKGAACAFSRNAQQRERLPKLRARLDSDGRTTSQAAAAPAAHPSGHNPRECGQPLGRSRHGGGCACSPVLGAHPCRPRAPDKQPWRFGRVAPSVPAAPFFAPPREVHAAARSIRKSRRCRVHCIEAAAASPAVFTFLNEA